MIHIFSKRDKPNHNLIQSSTATKMKQADLMESVFDFDSLNDYEMTILSPNIWRMLKRDKGDTPKPHSEILKPVTKEEYYEDTDQYRRYRDISTILIIRGEFQNAKKYEILSNTDFVKNFESIPRDVFSTNEYEYYEWRKKNP